MKVALLKLQYFGHTVSRSAGDNLEGKRYREKLERQWLDNMNSGVFKGGGHGSLSPPRDVGKKCALPVIKCLMDYSTV